MINAATATASLGAIVLAATVGMAGQSAPSGDKRQTQVRSEREQDERYRKQVALREGGIPGAAAVTGSVSFRRPVVTDGSVKSLDQLSKISDIIVVGTTTNNQAWMTDDQRSIRTAFTVQPDIVLKSRGAAASTLTVVLPGGRIGFSDGSWAQENTPGLVWPSKGSNYVWFLRKATGQERALIARDGQKMVDGPVYVPVSGPLGIINLAHPTGVAYPSGGFENPVARELVASKTTPAVLMERLRAINSREPIRR